MINSMRIIALSYEVCNNITIFEVQKVWEGRGMEEGREGDGEGGEGGGRE